MEGCVRHGHPANVLNMLADEFDANGAPNNSIWNYNIGTGENGWGNGELQYYTNRTENVTVQNGILIITANKEVKTTHAVELSLHPARISVDRYRESDRERQTNQTKTKQPRNKLKE